MGNTKFTLRNIMCHKTAVCTLIGLLLTGCTNTTPAPISRAGSVTSSNSVKSDGGYANSNVDTGNSALSTGSTGWVPAPSSIVVAKTAQNQSQDRAPTLTINNEPALGSVIPSRNYAQIPKGTFGGKNYTVARGDSLFYIAWISGNDYRDLAAKNNISEPYNLVVGQILDVSGGSFESVNSVANNTNTPNNLPVTDSPSNKNVGNALPSATTSQPTTGSEVASEVTKGSTKIVWRWPAEGKIIDSFSSSEGGNKGIDIAGSRGQSVVSAAEGRVVYAGNALRGYGNLIIIKHDDDYLSAYAHNDTMLVSEQQDVKAGQKIATMGSTGASSVRLHFEVRFKGKSVNPLQYLPRR